MQSSVKGPGRSERIRGADARAPIGAAAREAFEQIGLGTPVAIDLVGPEAGELAQRRGRRRSRLARVESDPDDLAFIGAMRRPHAEVADVLELRDGRVAEHGVTDGTEEGVAIDLLEALDLERGVVAAGAEPLRLVTGGEFQLAGEA